MGNETMPCKNGMYSKCEQQTHVKGPVRHELQPGTKFELMKSQPARVCFQTVRCLRLTLLPKVLRRNATIFCHNVFGFT